MSLFDTIKRFNWVDVVIIILFARTVYIAVQNGLLQEFFKLFGTILAVYVSLHYYSVLAHPVILLFGAQGVSMHLWTVAVFVLLILAGYLVAFVLRKLFLRFAKMELAAGLLKWGGFILGIARGFLFTSLVLYVFVIFPFGYLKNSVKVSYSGKFFFSSAPATYAVLWNVVMSKFMVSDKFNTAVSEVQKTLEETKTRKK